ncbi:DUF4214 domain-containing protein [Bdellovibrio sp.]|uniref:DUF4214 domain-containing protein n=1 Tax=Bdellovibrio sp. TaxID=28201 RepID=UPI0039E6A9A5
MFLAFSIFLMLFQQQPAIAMEPIKRPEGLLCAEQALDNPYIDAGSLINACLQRTSGRITLRPGRYYLKTRIDFSNVSNVVLTTLGRRPSDSACEDSKTCAELYAHDDFINGPLFVSQNAQFLTLDHVIINGNKINRLAKNGTSVAIWGNPNSFNSAIHQCRNCQFIGLSVIQAVRGTGMEFSGENALFDRVVFKDNGRSIMIHPNTNDQPWADGLTVHSGPGLMIINSEFSDNSDVNLIIGHAPRAQIRNNRILNSYNFAFAGLMLDNFNGSTLGDFSDSLISNNIVDCGPLAACGIGIDLGPWLWYQPQGKLINGGIIANNKINEARVGISIYGAQGTQISGNRINSTFTWSLSNGRCQGAGIDQFSSVNGMTNRSLNIYDNSVGVSFDRLRNCLGQPPSLAALKPTRHIDMTVFSRPVTEAFQILLNRAPDFSGGNYFDNILRQGNSVRSVLVDITKSEEFTRQLPTDNRDFVIFLYQRILKRNADPGGLEHFVNSLNSGTPRQAVIENFIDSLEFMNRYPALIH